MSRGSATLNDLERRAIRCCRTCSATRSTEADVRLGLPWPGSTWSDDYDFKANPCRAGTDYPNPWGYARDLGSL